MHIFIISILRSLPLTAPSRTALHRPREWCRALAGPFSRRRLAGGRRSRPGRRRALVTGGFIDQLWTERNGGDLAGMYDPLKWSLLGEVDRFELEGAPFGDLAGDPPRPGRSRDRSWVRGSKSTCGEG